MTDILSDLVRGFEGCKLMPYTDTVGKLTIGFGRNLADRGISQAEADLLLANDLALVRDAVAHALPWVTGMSATRQAVIQCMAFQLGISGLLGFHMLLTFCQQARYRDAAAAGRHSLWYDQTPARAEKLMQMLEAG
jgi:lysozyme